MVVGWQINDFDSTETGQVAEPDERPNNGGCKSRRNRRWALSQTEHKNAVNNTKIKHRRHNNAPTCGASQHQNTSRHVI